MHNIAVFCTLFAYDRRLCTAINKRLHRVPIHLYIYIKHRDVSEQLRRLIHRFHIVLLYHRLSNLFFDLFLSFYIVWVSIRKLHDAFLFSPFLGHHLLHPLSDNLLDFLGPFLGHFGKRFAELWVVLVNSIPEVFVLLKLRANRLGLLSDPLRLCIMEHLIEKLFLVQPGSGFFCRFQVAEKVLHEILVGGA